MMIEPPPPSMFTADAVVEVSVRVNRTVPIGVPCFAVVAVAITYSESYWKTVQGVDHAD
jgi:hypothetical protein